jgi:hypothetical protein
MGLPLELQNLIILTYAATTNRRFVLRGGPFEPSIDSLPDELELREQALPDAAHWQRAVTLASSLFGLTPAQVLNAANVGRLVDDLRQAATHKRDATARLVAQVRDRSARYAAGTPGARQQTAESAQALLSSLSQAAEADMVSTLASAALHTSDAAVGRTLGQAQPCADALTNARWELFDAMRELQDNRRDAAATVLSRLSEALTSDEHVLPLKARLDELERDALRLLTAAAPPAPTPLPPTEGAPPAPAPAPVTLPPAPATMGPEVIEEKQQLHLSGAAATAALDDLKARLAEDQDLELTLSWRLQRKGTQL